MRLSSELSLMDAEEFNTKSSSIIEAQIFEQAKLKTCFILLSPPVGCLKICSRYFRYNTGHSDSRRHKIGTL